MQTSKNSPARRLYSLLSCFRCSAFSLSFSSKEADNNLFNLFSILSDGDAVSSSKNKEMETENTNVVEPQNAAPVVNPLDELGTAIEDFKLKIKAMFEESTVLSRKVKEVALIQKQKERDFIQARRAIERIRMAI